MYLTSLTLVNLRAFVKEQRRSGKLLLGRTLFVLTTSTYSHQGLTP